MLFDIFHLSLAEPSFNSARLDSGLVRPPGAQVPSLNDAYTSADCWFALRLVLFPLFSNLPL
jgi:hypothetical protein